MFPKVISNNYRQENHEAITQLFYQDNNGLFQQILQSKAQIRVLLYLFEQINQPEPSVHPVIKLYQKELEQLSNPKMYSLIKLALHALIPVIILGKQIALIRQNDRYVLKLNIANLKVNLDAKLSLKDKHSWIKSQQCKYCQKILPAQTSKYAASHQIQLFDNQKYYCSKSIFDKSQQQYGLRCSENHENCQILKQNVQIQIDNLIYKGKHIQLKVKDNVKHYKYDQLHILLVQRIYGQNPIVKNSQQESKDSTQPLQQKEPSFIGQYLVWGEDSLFDGNLITKNNKNQITIYQDISSIQKQILEVSPIQLKLEQTATQFTLSQIKLTQKIGLNHLQKQIQDHEFPIVPPKKGFLTLQTQNLILPSKYYNKFSKYLLETYFSTQNNHCELKDSMITCQEPIDFNKMQYLQLQLVINGVSVGFPIKSLFKNCRSKTCDIKLSSTQRSFFLDIFAVQLAEQTGDIRLFRLNNQWNQFYQRNQKYKKQNFNILWWMGSSIFYLIYYTVKIVFYLAIFSLLINCFYHWRKILEWLGEIVRRISKKRHPKQQGQLFQEDQDLEAKDTAKLIRGFKNRINRTFIQDQQIQADRPTTQQST